MKFVSRLIRFCRRNLVPRFLRNFYVLRKWIRGNPLRQSFVLDLRESDLRTIQLQFFGFLFRLLKDPKWSESSINLSIILSEEGFGYMSDLYSLYSILPSANAGNIEFFRTIEDCKQHHDDLVQGIFQSGPVVDNLPLPSKDVFQEPIKRFEVSAYYLNQARSFLKTFGSDHSIFFCDLTHVEQQTELESWNQFFDSVRKTNSDNFFLVLTHPSIREQKFVHSNVFHLRSLSFNLLEQFGVVQLSDGYIGRFGVLAAMAIQRNLPSLLFSIDFTGSSSPLDLHQRFLGLRSKQIAYVLPMSEREPLATI